MSNFFVKLIKNPFVINLLLVIVVSCGVVYGVLAWLDSYTRHNQAVVVPDVKGMKLEDAAEFFGNNILERCGSGLHRGVGSRCRIEGERGADRLCYD